MKGSKIASWLIMLVIGCVGLGDFTWASIITTSNSRTMVVTPDQVGIRSFTLTQISNNNQVIILPGNTDGRFETSNITLPSGATAWTKIVYDGTNLNAVTVQGVEIFTCGGSNLGPFHSTAVGGRVEVDISSIAPSNTCITILTYLTEDAGIRPAVSLMSVGVNAKSCIGSGTSCTFRSLVSLIVTPGNLSIGSSGSFVFGSYTASTVDQIVTGAFVGSGGYFYVNDLKGSSSGYYTTVQLATGMIMSGTTNIIPRTAVSIKTPAVGSAGVTLLAGSANSSVVIHSAMSAYQTLDIPRQLLVRASGSNGGRVGQYGVLPQMQLVIPAYQPVGTYTSTLVYTLYEN